jgi:hypothetical protein
MSYDWFANWYRGATNEFIIDDEELGDLLEVTVGHDNSGHHPSWHLDHLTITNTKTGQTFIFPCRSEGLYMSVRVEGPCCCAPVLWQVIVLFAGQNISLLL